MRIQLISLLGVAVAACGGHADVPCDNSSNCNLSGGGSCVAASTGNMWCAYPDPLCPDGYRFSDQDVGDGLGGTCVAGGPTDGGVDADAGPHVRKLTVMIGGSGTGIVTSAPTGLTCNANTCTQTFPLGTPVTLTQSATSGTFLGWSNDCTGTAACVVTMDEDRTVAGLFGTPGEALWSQQIGGNGDDAAQAIATDSDGNLIVVGHFQNSLTVGTTTITSAGSTDLFVAKLAAIDGSVVWIKSFGGTSAEDAAAVALDPTNNIYITGTFEGAPNFGGGPLANAGNVDGFALKLDAGGAYQWAVPLGGQFADGARSIAVSSTEVAVVGNYQHSMTVLGKTITNSGTSQGYLAEFGLDGSSGFLKTFPGTGTSSPVSVVFDGGGNIVVAGTLTGTADFGNGAVTSSMEDAFLAKYNGTGGFLLAKVLGGSTNDQATAVTVDASDNMLLVGKFTGSVAFGGASPLNTNTANVVFAKYSAAGAFDWAVAFGGTTAQIVPGGASANGAGDVVATGYFCGNLSFGTTMLASVGTCASGDTDIFTVRLSGSNGSALTANRDGGSSPDVGNGITQTSDGKHYLAGAFQGFADFGGTARTSAGGNDAIILGLAPL